MSDKESQIDELTALESIYTEDEFQIIEEDGHSGGKFTALLPLASPLVVSYKGKEGDPVTEAEFTVQFLPPIVLQFSMPENYPSVSPPNFTLSCSWLSRKMLSHLCRKLDDLWNENKGMEVLFLWTQFLKEEALSYLDINNKMDISEVHPHYLEYTCQKNSNGNSKNKNGLQRNCSENVEQDKEINGQICRESKLLKNTDGECDRVDVDTWMHSARKLSRVSASDHRAVVELSQGNSLAILLKEYNEQQRKAFFNKELISCQVCFQEKLGQHCIKFDTCGHEFCKECVTEYFEIQIKDGNVHCLNCPAYECGKQALPSLVKELVSPELFVKYDSVLLSSTLDTLTDIVYCPRTFCQYPVSLEPGEKIAHCPNCEYNFCVYCRMVYHGVAPCQFKSGLQRELVQQYQNADYDERKHLEQKYGKKQIQNLVDTCMSETWIMDNSQNCPTCGVAIEKSHGCNKMVCWKCNTFFCWLCKTRLNPSAPYLHFQNPGSPCYNLLFQGVHDDDDDEDEYDPFL